MNHRADAPGMERIGKLQTMLRTARRLADRIVDDPDLRRLVEIFFRIPAEDRRPIVDVLDREVEIQLASRSDTLGGVTTGLAVNKNARLYVRVYERDLQPAALPRDMLILNTMRAARIIALSPQEHDGWSEGILEAFRRITPADREAVARLNREVLALLEEVERRDASEGAPTDQK